jgi:hypothetical protein
LIESDFLKHIHAQNLQYPTYTFVNFMNLIETGYQQVNADSDPNLSSNGVLGAASGSPQRKNQNTTPQPILSDT